MQLLGNLERKPKTEKEKIEQYKAMRQPRPRDAPQGKKVRFKKPNPIKKKKTEAAEAPSVLNKQYNFGYSKAPVRQPNPPAEVTSENKSKIVSAVSDWLRRTPSTKTTPMTREEQVKALGPALSKSLNLTPKATDTSGSIKADTEKVAEKKLAPTTGGSNKSSFGSAAFNRAFKAARTAGEREFEFRGRKYNTRLKGKAPNAPLPKPTETPSPTETPTPSTAPNPSLASRRPKPTIEEDTPSPMPKSSSFKQAFAMARKSGEGSFTWRGKTYNTKVK